MRFSVRASMMAGICALGTMSLVGGAALAAEPTVAAPGGIKTGTSLGNRPNINTKSFDKKLEGKVSKGDAVSSGVGGVTGNYGGGYDSHPGAQTGPSGGGSSTSNESFNSQHSGGGNSGGSSSDFGGSNQGSGQSDKNESYNSGFQSENSGGSGNDDTDSDTGAGTADDRPNPNDRPPDYLTNKLNQSGNVMQKGEEVMHKGGNFKPSAMEKKGLGTQKQVQTKQKVIGQ